MNRNHNCVAEANRIILIPIHELKAVLKVRNNQTEEQCISTLQIAQTLLIRKVHKIYHSNTELDSPTQNNITYKASSHLITVLHHIHCKLNN
jgi:hypothetical protein